MTPLQQQRLIGSILLACVICGIALFFMSNAADPVEESIEPKIDPSAYSSVIEPLPSGDVEMLDELKIDKKAQAIDDDPHELAVEEQALKDASQHVTKKIAQPTEVETKAVQQHVAKKTQVEADLTDKKVKPVVNKVVESKPEPVATKKIIPQQIRAENTTLTQITSTNEWLLQVASFSVKENAEKIQEKITKLGYQSNIEPVSTASGSIYRVRIGPMNKVALQNISKNLKNKLGINAQLMRQPN